MKFFWGFIVGALSVSAIIAGVVLFLNKFESRMDESINETLDSSWEDK